jgi:hypothetical protein
MPADEDLYAIVEAWPALPEVIKAGVLALVNAGKVRHRSEAVPRGGDTT